MGGNGLTKQQGTLLYHVASRLKSQCLAFRPLLVEHVVKGDVKTEVQLNAALDYLLHHSHNVEEELRRLEEGGQGFRAACGIGVEVSEEQIEDRVGCYSRIYLYFEKYLKYNV